MRLPPGAEEAFHPFFTFLPAGKKKEREVGNRAAARMSLAKWLL